MIEIILGLIGLILFIILYINILSISKQSKEQVEVLKQIRDGYKPAEQKLRVNQDFATMFKPATDLEELKRKKDIGLLTEEEYLAEQYRLNDNK
jgi:predicted Holliday junction resolvase-like endonuclease